MDDFWNFAIFWVFMEFSLLQLVPATTNLDQKVKTLSINSSTISCDNDLRIKVNKLDIIRSSSICQSLHEDCGILNGSLTIVNMKCDNMVSCTVDLQDVITNPARCLLKYGYFNFSYSCTDMVESASCNFDSSWCNWQRNKNGNFDRFKWKRRTGVHNGPPFADHTPTSSIGRYAFIHVTNSPVEGDYAEIYIENIVPSEKQCLSFWYYLTAEGYMIQVLKNDLNIYNVSKPTQDKWHHVQVDVSRFVPYNKYKFTFKVVHGKAKTDGAIALDDVSLTNIACQDNVHDCSFENNDMCAWDNTLNYYGSNNSWIPLQGNDGSGYDGPAIDHTTGSGDGYYMLLVSDGNSDGYGDGNNDGYGDGYGDGYSDGYGDIISIHVALLKSRIFELRGTSCFSFWYQMSCTDNGRLNITVNDTPFLSLLEDTNNVWKTETVNLDVQQNGSIIAFIGIIQNYESCIIALDDISITPGSCSGIETHTHRCTDLNNIMDIEICPKFYLERYFQDLSLSFHPKKDGCLVYREILDSFKNECSSFTDEHNCHLELAKSINQFPECFHLYDFQIQYTCENTTGTILSKPEKKLADANNIGLIVGLVIGLLFLAVFVIVIVIFIRRCSFGKRNTEIANKIKRNDYIGQQQVAFPLSSSSVSHVQQTYPEPESSNKDLGYGNSGIPFQTKNCQYDYTNITATNSRVNEGKQDNELTGVTLQKDMPRGKYVSNDDEYAIVDPKAKTNIYHSKEDKTRATESYMVLDPNETGFDRSNFPDKIQPYELAKPVSDTYTDAENDQYAVSPEGTYDYSGSNRRNELEDNIYNHAVDDVYDSGSHKRTNEGKDDTYDHFFGQKTEDDYDISRKT